LLAVLQEEKEKGQKRNPYIYDFLPPTNLFI